mgnify:CR=1 FL=1
MTDDVSLDSVRVHIPHREAESPRPRRSGSSDTEKYWESPCCGRRERFQVNCIKFLTQYLLIVGLLIFFAVGLYQADTCEDSNMYLSLLMLIVGIALPSPSMK